MSSSSFRKCVLTLMSVLLWATAAHGQVIAGSSLYFDHTTDEQAFVAAYQLCVGGTDCREVGVTRVGTTPVLVCTIPSWVPRGRRDLTVRAMWKAPLVGSSEPSNSLSVVVVGKPERLRTTEGVTP